MTSEDEAYITDFLSALCGIRILYKWTLWHDLRPIEVTPYNAELHDGKELSFDELQATS